MASKEIQSRPRPRWTQTHNSQERDELTNRCPLFVSGLWTDDRNGASFCQPIIRVSAKLSHRIKGFTLALAASLSASVTPWSAEATAPAAAYRQILTLQGVTFTVQATGEGSQQELTITARNGRGLFKPIRQTVDGRVVRAEVADLNSNGKPEIYVLIQSTGSGSYGQLAAYSVINSNQLSPIYMPELSGASAEGYQGHDDFRVVEAGMVRTFPVYKSGDSNANATGGKRQICYKLENGEASWILRPTKVSQALQ